MALDAARANIRNGLAASLRDLLSRVSTDEPLLVLIACSGGADSLALAAAAAFLQGSREFEGRVRCGAVVVDHQMQQGSAAVAAAAGEACEALGLAPVVVMPVEVLESPQGVEAAAREARYEALTRCARLHGAVAVATAHTRDDQAETVLLALARGAGLAALQGMRSQREMGGVVLLRPLLEVTRSETVAACGRDHLNPWADPMNFDTQFARVAVRRRLLPLAHEVLGAGFSRGLARTAAALADDHDALETLADASFADLVTEVAGGWVVAAPRMVALPSALRRRVWLRMARAAGCGGELSAKHIAAVDALVTHWHGQSLTYLPARVRVMREYEKITFHTPQR